MKDGEINTDMVKDGWMNETTFSRAKREYGEYVSAVKWKNIVNEIKFQYAMLNVMLNEINFYSIV